MRGYGRSGVNPIVIIIIINVVMLIATMINPRLILFFGLQPLRLGEHPWTLLTAMFMHGGFWHLAANMFTLYFFGSYLSQLIGDNRLLLVYFGGGILGNVFFALLSPPLAIAVGASGAVFALGGALAVMRPRLRVFVFPIPVPLSLWAAVIGGFILLTILAIPLGIAWQAHLGGLIFGLVAGFFFKRRERSFYSR